MQHQAPSRAEQTGGAAVRVLAMPSARPDTFEEECAEVLAGVFDALCHHTPDPDEMDACAYLMRHLGGDPRARTG